MSIRVSIVVPMFNAEERIYDCIMSLLEQSCAKTDYEIILVDDGSTDKTLEIVDSVISSAPPLLKVLTQENMGQSVARNFGIKESVGKIVAFIDSDCVASTRWVEEIIRAFNDNDVDMIGGSVVVSNSTFIGKCDEANSFYGVQPIHKTEEREYIASVNMSILRSVLDSVGGFDESLRGAEDSELSYRVAHKLFVPEIVVRHNTTRTTLKKYLRNCYRNGRGARMFRQKYIINDRVTFFMELGNVAYLFLIPFSLAFAIKMFREFKVAYSIFPFLFLGKMLWSFALIRRDNNEYVIEGEK